MILRAGNPAGECSRTAIEGRETGQNRWTMEGVEKRLCKERIVGSRREEEKKSDHAAIVIPDDQASRSKDEKLNY